jgi:hypothetical protein
MKNFGEMTSEAKVPRERMEVFFVVVASVVLVVALSPMERNVKV